MVLGFVLFWVACALVYNTASAFGKVDGKETGPVNVIIGSLVVFIVLGGIVTDMFGQGASVGCSVVLLFLHLTFVFLN